MKVIQVHGNLGPTTPTILKNPIYQTVWFSQSEALSVSNDSKKKKKKTNKKPEEKD